MTIQSRIRDSVSDHMHTTQPRKHNELERQIKKSKQHTVL